MLTKSDKYGRGSAAANGEEFADFAPAFSVVIPVYNGAAHLRECLESVQSQSFTDWEAICIDDGSIDGSGRILDEFALQDSRFRVVHRKNEGVGASRNFALDMARGAYVGFLDCDDLWEQDCLTTIRDAVDGCPDVDFVRMTPSFWHEETDGCGRVEKYTCAPLRLVGNECVKRWVLGSLLSSGWSWLLFIRRDFLLRSKVAFPVNVPICEDVIFLIKLGLAASSAIQSPYCGYRYRIHGASAFHSKRAFSTVAAFATAVTDLFVQEIACKSNSELVGEIRSSIRCVCNAVFMEWTRYCAWSVVRGFEIASVRRAVALGLLDLSNARWFERIPIWFLFSLRTSIGFVLLRWFRGGRHYVWRKRCVRR